MEKKIEDIYVMKNAQNGAEVKATEGFVETWKEKGFEVTEVYQGVYADEVGLNDFE